MKRIRQNKMIWLAAVFTMAGCQKELVQYAPLDLLTLKEWKMTGHGSDSNGNNLLDEPENIIEDCQKDNTYLFLSNGKGHYSDNDLSCGNESNTEYKWEFLNNNASLKIAHERFSIIELNAHELVLRHELQHELPDVAKILIHYTH